MKIKKGDNVKVLVGKDKGKTGKVEKVYLEDNKVLIAGVNEFKRHVKSRAQNEKSEIKTITKPINATNVAIVCGSCKKTTRVGIIFEKGKKVRICRKCGKEISN